MTGLGWMVSDTFYRGYDDLKKQYNIKPELSTFESISQAELYFVFSHCALDYPRAWQPNMIPVGGLSAVPAKPLPEVSDVIVFHDDFFYVF